MFHHLQQNRENILLKDLLLDVGVVLGKSSYELATPPTYSIMWGIQARDQNEEAPDFMEIYFRLSLLVSVKETSKK